MSVTSLFQLSGNKLTKGEVGIEIEVEGERLPESIPGWRRENDGSLRGESAEYVLKNPIAHKDVASYLAQITTAYTKYKSVITDSQRAGVHVHINVQTFTMREVYNFICLYIIFEDMLVKFCGDRRQGNLFCLRARDAEALIDWLRSAAEERSFRGLGTDHLRYASVNVKALSNYGSLEFRAMRSTSDMSVIETWVNILVAVREAAITFTSPKEIIEQFSVLGPEGLFHRVLGPFKPLLLYKNYDGDMWDNARCVQDIAYCTNWEELAAWEHKIDNPINPFRKNGGWKSPYDEPAITAPAAPRRTPAITGTRATRVVINTPDWPIPPMPTAINDAADHIRAMANRQPNPLEEDV